MIDSYLTQTGLDVPATAVADATSKIKAHLTTFDGDVAWQYQIPELGEGGACSLFGNLQEEPFELTSVLGEQTPERHDALLKLSAIVDFVVSHTGLDWFGIYQSRETDEGTQLVKLAYRGAPSRPLFPLNEQFASTSNNVQVALSSVARVINDIAAYVKAGGEYYTCDPKVCAEACLPLLDSQNQSVGIIDGEAFHNDFFGPSELAILVAACLVIPDYLPG